MGSVLDVRVMSPRAAATVARQTSTAVASLAPMRRNMSEGVSASDWYWAPVKTSEIPNTAAIRLARRVREDACVHSCVVDMGRVSFHLLGNDGAQRRLRREIRSWWRTASMLGAGRCKSGAIEKDASAERFLESDHSATTGFVAVMIWT